MRRRITTVAVLVTGVVLLISGIVIVGIARDRLHRNLDASLEQRAEQFESSYDSDPAVVLATSDPLDRFAQLIDADGRVIAATRNVEGLGPLAPLPGGRQLVQTRHDVPIEDDDYRVLVRAFDADGAIRYALVGENVDDLQDDLRAMVAAVALVLPAALAAIAMLVWWLVGRTLLPVERIRAEVAGIGLDDLDRRVPAPASGDEIGRLAATMNDMLARLESSTRERRRFVADASHELRTPLTRLRAALEVEMAEPSGRHAETVASALEDTVEMQRLVDDLLLLAQHDATASSPPRHRLVDLDVVVESEAGARRAQTSVPISTAAVEPCMVLGDSPQLGRMVGNLLANAVRHARSRVDVTVAHRDGAVVLVVDDDGPGVPPGDRERVFERFVRLDESRTTQGSGLGLAIVRSIAERHGGTVSIGDAPRGGARVEVRLPSPRGGA